VIRPLVPLGETNPAGNPPEIDNVDANQFGLFASIIGKSRDFQRLPRASQNPPVSLVEPLRGGATDTVGGTSTGNSPVKHLLRIGLGLITDLSGLPGMHRVPLPGASEVCKPGPRHQHPGECRFGNGSQHPLLSQQLGVIKQAALPGLGHMRAEVVVETHPHPPGGVKGEADVTEIGLDCGDVGHPVAQDTSKATFSRFFHKLNQSHLLGSIVWL